MSQREGKLFELFPLQSVVKHRHQPGAGLIVGDGPGGKSSNELLNLFRRVGSAVSFPLDERNHIEHFISSP